MFSRAFAMQKTGFKMKIHENLKNFRFFKICNFVKIESKMNDFFLIAEVLFSKFASSASPPGGNLVDGLPPALGVISKRNHFFK